MVKRKRITMFHPYIPNAAFAAVEQVLKSKWIGQGELVDVFERKLKEKLNIPYIVSVNTSSSAIRLALDICGIKPGDEIITTPLTCTLTNHPILETFAKPVFADVQLDSGNIDPNSIEKRISKKTKAILCTHWGGMPADLDEIHNAARKYNLPVIEDASEALGATYKSRPIGTISHFTAFSFQAIQMITTGEGGALAMLSKKEEMMAKVKRWYGIDRVNRKKNSIGYYDFDITESGYGYHFTNIAAAIGIAAVKKLPKLLRRRRLIAKKYFHALQNVKGVKLLRKDIDRQSSCHFFTIRVQNRRDFCKKLDSFGIEASIIHQRNDAYSVFGGKRCDLPNLDLFDREYIALPTHLHLSDENIDYIISTIRSGW